MRLLQFRSRFEDDFGGSSSAACNCDTNPKDVILVCPVDGNILTCSGIVKDRQGRQRLLPVIKTPIRIASPGCFRRVGV
jgi:hypothetical protein